MGKYALPTIAADWCVRHPEET
eukprot:SAG11_NODE_38274_length_253_cov_0.655844_1_plen_21_part_10